MHVYLQKIVRCAKYFRYVHYIQRKYSTKTITGDHMTALTQETLTGRLLNSLINNRNQPDDVDKTIEILADLKGNDTSELEKCNIEKIICILAVLSNTNSFKSRQEYLKVLYILDNEFCRRMSELETKDKLKILNTYMHIMPHKIVQTRYYEEAVDELFQHLDTLSKNNLVQLIFYIGLQKKTAKSQYMLRKCMSLLSKSFINSLSTEEICIVCNATFKTSTKINSELFLNKINNYLKDNLYLLSDPALFITLIKTIRHNRFQTEDLLVTIAYTIFFNRTFQYYSFSALCHILALYSDFLYYDECLLKTFTERCMEQLKNSGYTTKRAYFKEQPRAKDINRLLWCLSNLNYKFLEENDIKNIIISNLLRRLENKELKNDYTTLIEIVLYLWMLKYHAYELLPYAFTQENIQYIAASNSATKRRLNLLLSGIYFEDRKLYKKLNIQLQRSADFYKRSDYDVKFQLEKRPVLQHILNTLKSIAVEHKVNKYEMNCQIPHLHIIGITGYQKIYKTVHIEILDEYTSMKNTDYIPTGLMDFKLRILEGFDEGLIVIRANEVNLMTDEELHDFLLDELDLVC